MRKLTHIADISGKEARRVSTIVPIIAGAAIMGCALIVPSKGVAEPAGPAAPCSASVERGSFTSHTSTTPASRLMRTPLLESGRYLQISMPNAYLEQVGRAASARPEAERQAFKAGIIQKNVSAALRALGTSQSAAFECVLPSASAPAAPQPAAPSSSTRPAQPAPAAPATSAPPAPQPEPGRRVIQPGNKSEPGKPAPSVAVPKK